VRLRCGMEEGNTQSASGVLEQGREREGQASKSESSGSSSAPETLSRMMYLPKGLIILLLFPASSFVTGMPICSADRGPASRPLIQYSLESTCSTCSTCSARTSLVQSLVLIFSTPPYPISSGSLSSSSCLEAPDGKNRSHASQSSSTPSLETAAYRRSVPWCPPCERPRAATRTDRCPPAPKSTPSRVRAAPSSSRR
jgi:hypothetical protein